MPAKLPADLAVTESLGYRLKTLLLGPPLVTGRLQAERLSRPVALGVLAPDCISSSAYGSEEMLRILVPVTGAAAFTLLMPVTLAILAILLLLTLTYRDVITVYTKAGGSYVVARENFGPSIAQIAAVALLIDYVVTVAVQAAAGTDAVLSLTHLLGWGRRLDQWSLPITVGVVALLCFVNLRGIRQAGQLLALPTYLFTLAVGVMIVVGGIRFAAGDLPRADTRAAGAIPLGHPGNSLLYGASLFIVLRAFANGGSSLTGLEAISNGVSAFREPRARNARRTLVTMSCILGTLVLGVSGLAYATHAIPYTDGSPTVIAQEARLAFGTSTAGVIGFVVVQLATALVLYTGANTSFNGFPFLASFVAGDRFLPAQLTRRGHRLAFSTGILTLTAASTLLLLGTGGTVDALVSLYAIGVFTGFTMAAAGLYRYHWRRRQPRRAVMLAVTGGAAVLSGVVVVIFAVTKFTQGAWLVVILFPAGVWALIRLNRRYREEAAALEAAPATTVMPAPERSVVLVLVNDLDLAVIKALRYARSLRPDELRAVHLMIDNLHAEQLRRRWEASRAADVPLEVIEVPDRRIPHAAAALAARVAAGGNTEVTIMLPRRTYSRRTGRLLHNHTAEQIAHAVRKLPRAATMIVPFDVTQAIDEQHELALGRTAHRRPRPGVAGPQPAVAGSAVPGVVTAGAQGKPQMDASVPIGSLPWREQATVEGHVRSVSVGPLDGATALTCELFDATGGVMLIFHGRLAVPGIHPGAQLRVTGMIGETGGILAITNPDYLLLTDDHEGDSR